MICAADTRDQPALVELIAEFYELDGHHFDDETVTAGLAPLLASDRHGVVLIDDDDGVLSGYAAVVWSYSIESGGPDALLDEIYVRQRGERRGERLMEAVFAEVRSRGMTRIFLETERPNHAARRFYTRLGFKSEDSIWMSADIR